MSRRTAGQRARRRGIAWLAFAAVAAVPVVAGCDTAPGAAAIVGGHRISITALQSTVDTALADPDVAATLSGGSSGSAPTSRADFIRQTLSRLVDEQLVAAVAAAHRVTVTPQEVSAQQASYVRQAGSLSALQQSAAQQVGVSAKQLPDLIRYTVLQQNVGSALTATLPASHKQLERQYRTDIDSYDQLEIAQIAVQSKSQARRILATVQRNPQSFPAQARRYSLDAQSRANGGLVGFVGRSRVLQLFGGNASAIKPGAFSLAHSSGEYIVLHVIKRRVQPLSAVEAKVKASLFSAQANALLGKAVTAEASRLGVHVNPRYGRWDASSQSVVAAPNPVSSSG